MKHLALARLVASLVLSSVMLMSGLASSYTLYRCSWDSLARRACCCPATERPRSETALLRAAGCCDQEKVEVVKPPAESIASHVAVVPPPASLTFVATLAAPVALPTRNVERPGSSPPLIVLKQSFLI